jgi:hypothetical protein
MDEGIIQGNGKASKEKRKAKNRRMVTPSSCAVYAAALFSLCIGAAEGTLVAVYVNGSLVMEVRSSVIGGERLPCTIFVEQLSAAVADFSGQGGRRNGCDGDDHQDQGNDTPGVFCHVFSPPCVCLSAFFSGTAGTCRGNRNRSAAIPLQTI